MQIYVILYILITVFELGHKKHGPGWDPTGLKKRGPQNKNWVPTWFAPMECFFFKCRPIHYILAYRIIIYVYITVCVCVCVWVRACVRVCVHAW